MIQCSKDANFDQQTEKCFSGKARETLKFFNNFIGATYKFVCGMCLMRKLNALSDWIVLKKAQKCQFGQEIQHQFSGETIQSLKLSKKFVSIWEVVKPFTNIQTLRRSDLGFCRTSKQRYKYYKFGQRTDNVFSGKARWTLKLSKTFFLILG